MTISQGMARRIDEYLFQKGITLYQLAKNAGLPVSTLQNLYRNTTKSPTVAVLYKICLGFNITVAEFLDCEYLSPSILELD